MNFIDDIKYTFKQGSILTRLIYINLGIFLLVNVLFFLFAQKDNAIYWLSFPDNINGFIQKPWTIISYMFLHQNFLHLLFNMLGLYWFGKMFLYHFEQDKILSLYILGGLAGAVLYFISFNLFPAFSGLNSLLLGSSASIFAILVAISFYEPDKEIHLFFIGRFPLKYVALFYIFLSVIGISTYNPGGNIAHLGGAFWGYLYITQLKKGKDIGAWLTNFYKKVIELFKPKPKIKVTFKQPPRDDHEYNRQKSQHQKEINRILEKISKSGYDSLTKNEKEILFKSSNKK